MLDAIGDTLREARESRGWSLEEVEKATHIRTKYLVALEAGDLDSLPSMHQARGFLRNYAQHLGLKPDQVLGQMDEALKPVKRGLMPSFNKGRNRNAPQPDAADFDPEPNLAVRPRQTTNTAPSRVAPMRRLRRFFTPDLIIAVVAIVAVVGFLVWGGSRLVNNFLNPPPITPTVEIIGPTAEPTSTIIANITPSPTSLPPGITFTNVQLILTAEKRTFVRVSADGAVVFEGIMLPEEQRNFTGEALVEVTTGDGSSLRVNLNARDLGLLGAPGEVITRQFIPAGMVTVTATISPTPPETPTPGAPPTETPAP
jgi:cytoskeleton protein RodZ